MNLNNKCLLVLKPAEPFQQWLQSTLNQAEAIIQKDEPALLKESVEINLDDLQADASSYLMPVLSPEQNADFLRRHFDKLFSRELDNWCNYKEAWPLLDFANFAASFKFEYYYDWMNFNELALSDGSTQVESLILLAKPKEQFTEYLRTLLVQKFSIPENEVDKKLDLNVIEKGSTAVITNISSLDDVDYFLNQNGEDIFRHQLMLWGGEGSEALWPRDTDWRAFKEAFNVEIHSHNYVMTQ